MFDPVIAERRFGCGLSPRVAAPRDMGEMLAWVGRPDTMAERFRIQTFADFLPRMERNQKLKHLERGEPDTQRGKEAATTRQALLEGVRADTRAWLAATLSRRIQSTTPFMERLESFWADHFTAVGKGGMIKHAGSPYVESAIRPHLGGRFEDMVVAVETHPVMIHYLDQATSVGPNSIGARLSSGKIGLNENLAREILELHTLGAGGPYMQDDVRQLAELMTGMRWDNSGMIYQARNAEPGPETVLGKDYGGLLSSGMDDIETALRDIANHPAVAGHLARKLAIHFVSDTPPPALVAALERTWTDTRGDLPAVYETLLTHPDAWDPAARNFKPPVDFMASALRALDVPHAALADLSAQEFHQRITQPLRQMGHNWQLPDGPDGLPEEDAAWLTPQGVATRLQWAVTVPQLLLGQLPDPREFLATALGPEVPGAVRFAAGAAESRADGVGLVLASPAFQRV